MKLHTRLVAVGTIAALAMATPAAAHAAGKPDKPAKGKPAAAAKGQAKALGAQLDRARGAKKAAQERGRFALAGTVTAVDAATATVTITRKQRGVVVDQQLAVDPAAQIRRDGLAIALADVQVGEKVVAHTRRVDGKVVVVKLNVASQVSEPVSDTATATITI
jgi:hypothetical protein